MVNARRTLIAAAAAAALPSAVAQPAAAEAPAGDAASAAAAALGLGGLRRDELTEREHRMLMHYTVIFEECVGRHLDECKALIQAEVEANPVVFEGRASLEYEVMPVRALTDVHYNRVALRTNLAETHVVGILGDGMVWYPYDWCDSVHGCMQIGPWDCDMGAPLTVQQCCDMIRISVPNPDTNGNMLECWPDYPVGSASNPTDYGRVCIHVDQSNIVVRPPRNE